MNKNLTLFFGGLFLLISTVTLKAEMKWNMPTPYGDGYFQTKNVREFVADIKEKTGGDINIAVHSGASLYPSTEIFRAIRGGQAEIGELLMSNMGNENALFNVDSIPFLAVGYAESKKLWDVSRSAIESSLDKMGVKLLYAVPWPPQNFYTKKELNDVSFFKGSKLRAYNAITSQMADLLGASPTTIQVPEIPQAFTTGIIDAMITSGATGVSSQAWDFTKYYIEVSAWMPKNMVFINKRVWNRLSDKNKKIIQKAALEAEERGWKYSEEANKQDRATLGSNGMKIVTPNQKMMSNLKKVGKKMVDDWLKSTGKKGREIIDKFNK